MRRLLIYIVPTLLLCFMLSCRKEPAAISALEGKTWSVVQVDTMLNGQAVRSSKTDKISIDGNECNTFRFDQGVATIFGLATGLGTDGKNTPMLFTYSYLDGYLYLKGDWSTIPYKVLILDNTTLVLQGAGVRSAERTLYRSPMDDEYRQWYRETYGSEWEPEEIAYMGMTIYHEYCFGGSGFPYVDGYYYIDDEGTSWGCYPFYNYFDYSKLEGFSDSIQITFVSGQ